MNFIEAKNGHLYPAGRIVSIGPSIVRGGEQVRDVEIDGLGTVVFYDHRISEFLRQPVQVHPAQSGTYVIHLSDEMQSGYWMVLVTGWAHGRDNNMYPVTVEGVNDGVSASLYVLTPDGRVSQGEMGSWDSLDDLLRSESRVAASNEA